MFGCALLLTWGAPAIIERLASSGISPRGGVTAWLTAVGATLVSWFVVIVVAGGAAIRSLTTGSQLTICGKPVDAVVALGLPAPLPAASVGGIAALGMAVCLLTVYRVGAYAHRGRAGNREHASAARIIGRPVVAGGTAVIITAAQPAAYCVAAGRRDTIVLTSAAMDRLDDAGVAAVIAHENAHLRGRHPLITAVLTALAEALPRFTVLTAAARAVPPLLEMCADDAAVGVHGRGPLLDSLVALACAPAASRVAPEGALQAAAVAVVARVTRLATPASARHRWRERTALSAIIGITAALPPLAILLC
jgi:Zn-dependent protease with chaperone function